MVGFGLGVDKKPPAEGKMKYMNIQTVIFDKLSFINVTNPGDLEIKYLKTNFDFDTLHLDDYINKTQIPKIETFKNYTLLVMDIPYYNLSLVSTATPNNTKPSEDKTPTKTTLESIMPSSLATMYSYFSSGEKRKRLKTTQVYFFVGKDYLVVLHENVLIPITTIFTQCQKALKNRNEYMGQGPVFLTYRIMDALVDSCFPIMNGIASSIDRIDKELEGKGSEDTIEDITLTRRNIVLFQTAVKPMRPLFLDLESGKYSELNGTMQPYWGNVYDHLQRIWERLEDSRELIEGISDSNESLLSYRNNKVIKVLTIFSAIILPLNLLASMYGMNILLPFANEPFGFEIIVLLMIILALLMFLGFKAKRWF